MRRPGASWVLGGAAGLTLLGAGTLLAGLQTEPFPHAVHQGLFPLCTGCHASMTAPDRTTWFPAPEICARCHDGTRLDPVSWSPPERRPSPVRFDHGRHEGSLDAAGETQADCATCHRPPGASQRMDVVEATPDRCLACHAHAAPDHLDAASACATCHPPASELPDLSLERLAAYPRPDDHDASDFTLTHGTRTSTARCGVCHARPSCSRCHLNAASLPTVDSLAPDERFRTLAGSHPPDYPLPPDHAAPSWAWQHGHAAATEAATCASCHVRRGCDRCHGGVRLPAVEAQPVRPEGDPRGVVGTVRAVHPPGYPREHRADAASGEARCASCHRVEEFCVGCHDGPDTPAFHRANFLERHGPEAYASASDCSSCHSTEVFCRRCHQGTGLAGGAALGSAFHSARPFWLVGHGVAARQGLEGCVSCHRQSDCTRCHSARTGWGINPHGPSFDPTRAREANPLSCVRCHFGGGIS